MIFLEIRVYETFILFENKRNFLSLSMTMKDSTPTNNRASPLHPQLDSSSIGIGTGNPKQFSENGFDPPEEIEASSCPDASWLKDQAAGRAMSQEEMRNIDQKFDPSHPMPTCPKTQIF
jgi:hypothetical protein